MAMWRTSVGLAGRGRAESLVPPDRCDEPPSARVASQPSRECIPSHPTAGTPTGAPRGPAGRGEALAAGGTGPAGAERVDDCDEPMELGGLEPPTSWVRSRRSPN